ncbi:MAG TPA: helical backbone metal receptor [Candidatus Eremiobacteraceae bacterium]|nr:helical backbone metal receptor [Candidatus Eremiobacteraceae bacterium]
MRALALCLAMCSLCTVLASCAPHTKTRVSPSTGPRIISLAPSLTEIAFAIGCGNRLVADTVFDDYPAASRTLPHVADTRTANLELVAALKPTTVVALHDQELEGSPIARQLGIPVLYLPNRDLGDLNADIEGVGRACSRTTQAAALARSLDRRIAAIADAARAKRRPRVLYLLGLPGFAAGRHSFLGDMIEAAGGENVAASSGEPYPDLNAEAIVRADPDIIVVAADTPFDKDVQAQMPWRALRAVRDGAVLRPPSDDIMERNGPRIVDGLAWLHTALAHRSYNRSYNEGADARRPSHS